MVNGSRYVGGGAARGRESRSCFSSSTSWYDSFGVTGAGERSHSSAMNTSSSTSSAQNDTVLCIRGGLAHSHSSPAQLGDVRPDPLGVGGTLTSGVSGGVWVSFKQPLRILW